MPAGLRLSVRDEGRLTRDLHARLSPQPDARVRRSTLRHRHRPLRDPDVLFSIAVFAGEYLFGRTLRVHHEHQLRHQPSMHPTLGGHAVLWVCQQRRMPGRHDLRYHDRPVSLSPFSAFPDTSLASRRPVAPERVRSPGSLHMRTHRPGLALRRTLHAPVVHEARHTRRVPGRVHVPNDR